MRLLFTALASLAAFPSLTAAFPHSFRLFNQPTAPPPSTESSVGEWMGWGGDVYNNRWAVNNTAFTAGQSFSLNEVCSIDYHKGVSATPTVVGDISYYPSYNGSLVALNITSCQPLWQFNVTAAVWNYAPLSPIQQKLVFSGSRTSPVIDGDVLYIGTEHHALLLAIHKLTGQLLGQTQINPHPLAVATMSPTVYNGMIFIGTSSREESAPLKAPNYPCCSFIGNVAAFRFDNSSMSFNTVWNTTTLPLNSNWTGAGVWGSQPSVDPVRQQIFVATGNVYTYPDEYAQCRNLSSQLATLSSAPLTADPCIPPGVYQETVLALDMATGYVNWVSKLSPIDAWTAVCGFGNSIQHRNINDSTLPKPRCPYRPGPDADFGMAPTFVPGSENTPMNMDVVVIGEKNGNLFSLTAEGGETMWAVDTSPHGNLGGLSFGIAVDSTNVYFTAMNSDYQTWTLQGNNNSSGLQLNNSAWGAADLRTGAILWNTPVRNDSFAFSPPTVAGDVVFVAREDSGWTQEAYLQSSGALVILDKQTGQQLGEYPVPNNVHGGISVINDYVLFGSGYHTPYNGTGGIHVLRKTST